MKQRIEVKSEHIADLWRLDCVVYATKIGQPFAVLVTNDTSRPYADGFLVREGDWLCEGDDGRWYVEEGGAR